MKKKKKKPAGLKRSRPSATEASLNNEIVWNYLPSFNHHQNSTETSNWANKYYFGTSHSDHSTSEHTCSSFLFRKKQTCIHSAFEMNSGLICAIWKSRQTDCFHREWKTGNGIPMQDGNGNKESVSCFSRQGWMSWKVAANTGWLRN